VGSLLIVLDTIVDPGKNLKGGKTPPSALFSMWHYSGSHVE
jgi:hypothetical protein